jgi:hypothetical protein
MAAGLLPLAAPLSLFFSLCFALILLLNNASIYKHQW